MGSGRRQAGEVPVSGMAPIGGISGDRTGPAGADGASNQAAKRTAKQTNAMMSNMVGVLSSLAPVLTPGVIECEAKAVHTGRNTQVWDALVRHRDTGKLIATFRCTQMILYAKPGR